MISWPRCGRTSARDVRASLGRVFADLHSDLDRQDGRLSLRTHRSRHPVSVEPRGLVLIPSVLRWPYVGIKLSTTTATTLAYPARGIGCCGRPEPAHRPVAPSA
ncbi:MAG: hypothetical protein ABI301_05055 [Jatrophihabitantaceae bacterium]